MIPLTNITSTPVETQSEQELQGPVSQVNDPPKFDLETYIANYDTPTSLDRLTHIGLTSVVLQKDALTSAQSYAKSSRNVPRYKAVSQYLEAHYPDDPSVRLDDAWVSETSAQVSAETTRLEGELKGYKNNLIKESIRMAQEELGTHHFVTGNLIEANRSFGKMRDHCTTQAHLAHMTLRQALVAVGQQNWTNLQVCVSRLQSQPTFPEFDKITPSLKPLLGLASLGHADYTSAALHFVQTDTAFTAPMEPVASGVILNRAVLSPNDVATYGALCALATLTYDDILSKTLQYAAPFRQLLELEPHMKRLLDAFTKGDYPKVTETISSHRVDWLCDAYLHRHVEPLLLLIRRKCIIQYFSHMGAARTSRMADLFGTGDKAAMEAELATMIEMGLLNARIDAAAGALYKPRQRKRDRVAAAAEAVRAAEVRERAMDGQLWRAELRRCGLEVKAL